MARGGYGKRAAMVVLICGAGLLGPLVVLVMLLTRGFRVRVTGPMARWCGKRWGMVQREWQRWQY